jgi:hypothetical protein
MCVTMSKSHALPGRSSMQFLQVTSFLLVLSTAAWAAPTPPCPQATGAELPINNEQVLEWKKSTAQAVRSRVHIKGKAVQEKKSKAGSRIAVKIGPDKKDVVEIFYHGKFSPRPNVKKGQEVQACGEFIFDGSSEFGIVHRVHAAKNPKILPGFLVVQGKVYGGH